MLKSEDPLNQPENVLAASLQSPRKLTKRVTITQKCSTVVHSLVILEKIARLSRTLLA
jgi:hypothetical protein